MTGLEDGIRCPQCGARNGADADWCTQCYASLKEPEPEPEPAPAPEAPPPPPPPPPPSGDEPEGLLPLPPPPPGMADVPAPDVVEPEARELAAGSGRFRQTATGLEWSCGICGEWNSIDLLACTACGAAFGRERSTEDEATKRPHVAPVLLAGSSLVLPGAGHWLLGLRGAAALRAVLALVWGIGGITLFAQARGSDQSVLPAVPLLFGWLVLAATSANDAIAEGGHGGSVLLQGRAMLWLTLGVVGGLLVAVFIGVIMAVGN